MTQYRTRTEYVNACQVSAPMDAIRPATDFGAWLERHGAKNGSTFFVAPVGPPDDPDPAYVTFNTPDGAQTVGPRGWVTVDSAGTFSVWKEQDFQDRFEPTGEVA